MNFCFCLIFNCLTPVVSQNDQNFHSFYLVKMISNRRNSYIVLLLFYYFLIPACAESQNSILQKYIAIGIAENLQLQKNELSVQKQQLKAKEAAGSRMPVFTFEASYLLSAGGRTLAFPVGDLFNPTNQAINDLTQSNSLPTNLENVNEQLTPNDFQDTRFYVSVPLFNPAIHYNLKAQKQLITVEQAKTEAYKIELTKEIEVAYYNYFKTLEVLTVLDESERLLNDLYRFNQKLVKYDKATEDVLAGVRYEIEKIQSDRAGALQQKIMARAYFNSLLNRDLEAKIEKEVDFNSIATANNTLESLRAKAIGNRPELNQISNAIAATQIVTQVEAKALLPTIGLHLSGGMQGNGYAIDRDKLLGTLTIGGKWTIYGGNKVKQKIEQSQIETLQLQKELALAQQQIDMQVIGTWSALNTAMDKLKAEKAAVENAEKNFDLIKKKYENEKAILIEYLDARTKLSSAKIRSSIAQYDVLIRQAELKRATTF